MLGIIKFIFGKLIQPWRWPGWKRFWWAKTAYLLLIAILILKVIHVYAYPPLFRWYTGDKTGKLTFPSQRKLTPPEFERLAADLQAKASSSQMRAALVPESDSVYAREKGRLMGKIESIKQQAGYTHIDYFRKAGIREYKGPETCLKCHKTMQVVGTDGEVRKVNTLSDVMGSTHFLLFGMGSGFTTYGYNGREVNKKGRPIPVGKIDRACGIPGSFTWTGWAALAKAHPENGPAHYVSEGCGQCHIGGMYGPPSDYMMPIHFNDNNRNNSIDCLICHARDYDMNEKYVIKDDVGTRWNQDRSLKAALTVGTPTADVCLRYHQHNMGGDTYEHNEAAKHLGYENPRLLHNWSKRGTAYSAYDDIHAKVGMQCLDCHVPVGHKIPRGSRGVDLVSNDLPGVEVSCEKCHTQAPHYKNKATRAVLNGHSSRIACQTCHITKLTKNSVVLIDWTNPVFNSEEGVYLPNPILRSGDVRLTVGYLWYQGSGTFLANALGDNPSNPGRYNPLMKAITRYNRIDGYRIPGANLVDNDFLTQLRPELLEQRRRMIEQNILPAQELGISKIQPFHLFNAQMYEDMNNQGPFGAMIMPFDYKTYFETGDSRKAVDVALGHPIVKRMYQFPFKVYMMDDFMKYFGILEGWKTDYPLDDTYPGKIEPHWMRQMGTIALNHGISQKGFACTVCHTPSKGLLNFRELGYSDDRVKDLENLPELKIFQGINTGFTFEDIYGPGGPTRTR